MTHNNTFELILNIVYETMPRDNLLNSACLELFEFVKRENIKPIIIHVVEKYRDKLKEITYVDTFQNLILRYDQMQGYGAEPDATLFSRDDSTTPTRHLINGGQRWQGVREMDASEEQYFDTSDDEEDEVGSLSNGTVASNVLRRRRGLIVQHQQGKRTSETAVASNGSASPVVKPLVDYPDDDDDTMDVLPQEQLSQQQQPRPDLLRDRVEQGHVEAIAASRGAVASIPVAAQGPLERYSEKRRRSEEDDDDELVKLSSGPKRRSSNASAGSGSVSFLRRKRSFTAGTPTAAEKKNDQSLSSGTTTGSGGRKIAINLTMSSTLKVAPNQNHATIANTAKESKKDGGRGGNRDGDGSDDGGGGGGGDG